MAAIHERIGYLEGRVEEQGQMVNGIREAMQSLEARLGARMQSFEARVDQRIQGLEARMDQRFALIDQRFLGIDQRLDSMDAKLTRYFTWLVGLYVTTLVAVVAALVSR